jgi:serine/threonine-protein kinase RsbW
MTGDNSQNQRRILGRVEKAKFVGRAGELARIVSHPTTESRGLLLLLAPTAGVSELLRQAYDELFRLRTGVVPIYYALPRTEVTSVSVAIGFLNTFLLQYLAYRCNEPSLCQAPLILNDILKLAPAADVEWIEDLLTNYAELRFGDDRELFRLCFGAPARVPVGHGRPYVMIDAIHFAGTSRAKESLQTEVFRLLDRLNHPFAIAGLRREVLDAAHGADCDFESLDLLRLEKLDERDAQKLVESAAQRQQVELSEETRDLLVQQFDHSPFFTTTMLQAAREKQLPLVNFLACEQLYVDELLGGHLNHYFASLLEEMAPRPETRRALVRLLYEATVTDNKRASFEAWRKLLGLEHHELKTLLNGLHGQEFVNWDGGLIEAGGGPAAWRDFLRSRYHLDIQNEPRALVVAEMIANALKRAPHTMAMHYSAAAKIKLRHLVASFNLQLVPRILFHYEQFKESYRGASLEETLAGLDAETDLIRLPQVFHTAPCSAFSRDLLQLNDLDSCVVAHAFEGASYSDANELVWLVAEVDSKLEADRALTEAWLDRLEGLGNTSGFPRVHILLVSNEGFSHEAVALLEERGGYGVSRQQVDLLAARLGEEAAVPKSAETEEYVTVLPMGGDNELVAASIVEQIARRVNFKPPAINQIKTAIVEAFINAAEHSLSPDRKISQRISFENDRLVINISSRGVLPIKSKLATGIESTNVNQASEGRRGWGLKLIRSLMDEVEFERVDDGTSLRMVKYLRS